MTKRRALWLLSVVAVLALAAGLLFLPNWFYSYYQPRGLHEGHSASYWIDALDSPDAEVRHKAIFAVGTLAAESDAAVPTLARIVAEDPDSESRQQAALALSKLYPASRAAVPALARALADQESLVRMNAAMALLRLGVEARPAIPALIRALHDDANRTSQNMFHKSIQEVVVQALGRAGAGSSEAIAALIEALAPHDERGVRLVAAHALGELGSEGRSAVPQLRKMLHDDDEEVRFVADEALRKIEGRPAEDKN